MSFDTFLSIRDALEGDAVEFGLIDRFEGAMSSWEAQQVLRNHALWVEREMSRLDFVKPVLDELLQIFGPKKHFLDFVKEVTRRDELPPPEDRRTWLALYRSVESSADGFVTLLPGRSHGAR